MNQDGENLLQKLNLLGLNYSYKFGVLIYETPSNFEMYIDSSVRYLDRVSMIMACAFATSGKFQGLNMNKYLKISGGKGLRSIKLEGLSNIFTRIDVDIESKQLIDLRRTFMDCNILKELNIINLDTSHVKNTSYMFYRCTNLQELDLRSLDTSSITCMDGMFGECINLKSLNTGEWKLPKLESAVNIFKNCLQLREEDIRALNLKSSQLNYVFPVGING